jgi:hypothetical protein
MSAIARAARRSIARVAWRQWLTVLIGAAVIAAMVLVAEIARTKAERHLRAQVLVERVRADGHAIGATGWQSLAMLAAGRTRAEVEAQMLPSAFATWGSLSSALAQLRAADPGPATTHL